MGEAEVERRKEVARVTMRPLYFSFAAIYPLYFFIVYMATYSHAGFVPLSIGAFSQPYAGELGAISIALGAVGVAYLAFTNLFWIPRIIGEPRNRIMVFVIPEGFGIAGFVIGFMNLNPWAAIPFLLVAFANYVYVYTKVTAMEVK